MCRCVEYSSLLLPLRNDYDVHNQVCRVQYEVMAYIEKGKGTILVVPILDDIWIRTPSLGRITDRAERRGQAWSQKDAGFKSATHWQMQKREIVSLCFERHM